MNFKFFKIQSNSKRGLIGAILAAVAASICCVGPLVLLALGVGGAWVGSLTALEPFRPYLMAITFIFLGYAFYRIYRKPKAETCEPGSYCANPKSDKINKISLWTVTSLIAILFAIPYVTGFSAKRTHSTNVSSALTANRLTKLTLSVPDMSCPSCPFTVQKALKKVPGVIQAEVSFEQKKAVVLFDAGRASADQLVQATTDAGYPSTVIKKQTLQ